MTSKEIRKKHSALLADGEWMTYCGDEEKMKDPEYQKDFDLMELATDIICSGTIKFLNEMKNIEMKKK